MNIITLISIDKVENFKDIPVKIIVESQALISHFQLQTNSNNRNICSNAFKRHSYILKASYRSLRTM